MPFPGETPAVAALIRDGKPPAGADSPRPQPIADSFALVHFQFDPQGRMTVLATVDADKGKQAPAGRLRFEHRRTERRRGGRRRVECRPTERARAGPRRIGRRREERRRIGRRRIDPDRLAPRRVASEPLRRRSARRVLPRAGRGRDPADRAAPRTRRPGDEEPRAGQGAVQVQGRYEVGRGRRVGAPADLRREQPGSVQRAGLRPGADRGGRGGAGGGGGRRAHAPRCGSTARSTWCGGRGSKTGSICRPAASTGPA